MMSILLVVSDESKDIMLNGARIEGLILVVELIGRHSTREPIGHDDVDCLCHGTPSKTVGGVDYRYGCRRG